RRLRRQQGARAAGDDADDAARGDAFHVDAGGHSDRTGPGPDAQPRRHGAAGEDPPEGPRGAQLLAGPRGRRLRSLYADGGREAPAGQRPRGRRRRRAADLCEAAAGALVLASAEVGGDAFEDVLAANEEYARGFALAALSGRAARGLAVLPCIDTRIEPLPMLGLLPGDAKILR